VAQEWTDRGVPASTDRLAVEGLTATRELVDAIDPATVGETHAEKDGRRPGPGADVGLASSDAVMAVANMIESRLRGSHSGESDVEDHQFTPVEAGDRVPVRQSTVAQVRQNTESTNQQYPPGRHCSRVGLAGRADRRGRRRHGRVRPVRLGTRRLPTDRGPAVYGRGRRGVRLGGVALRPVQRGSDAVGGVGSADRHAAHRHRRRVRPGQRQRPDPARSQVQTGRPFTARGVARIRDAYKIFGPRTVAVRDGEGQRQTGCRRARYPRRRRLQLAATRGGPRPPEVPASACVSPWDPATREIYRQKVANSFRLKPVLADAAETNPTTGRRRLITRRCTGQRCARYGRTCPGPAWAADGTAERNISARRRVRIEAVRRRSAEPVEDQFV
jgi:hypothetical protein